jgi:hypothetical protein
MKTLKTLPVVILILLVTFLFVQPVEAAYRGGGYGGHSGGHGGGYGGGHRGGFGHGFFGGFGYGWWGYPYWWDYPYYPYYSYYPYYPYYYSYYDPYYYRSYGEPPAPPQGVPPPSESAQQQPSLWRFCQDPEGYYPYVKDCRGGWLRVVPPKPDAPPPAILGAPILPPSPPPRNRKSKN